MLQYYNMFMYVVKMYYTESYPVESSRHFQVEKIWPCLGQLFSILQALEEKDHPRHAACLRGGLLGAASYQALIAPKRNMFLVGFLLYKWVGKNLVNSFFTIQVHPFSIRFVTSL